VLFWWLAVKAKKVTAATKSGRTEDEPGKGLSTGQEPGTGATTGERAVPPGTGGVRAKSLDEWNVGTIQLNKRSDRDDDETIEGEGGEKSDGDSRWIFAGCLMDFLKRSQSRYELRRGVWSLWSGQIDPTCIRININVERSGRFPDGNPMQETIVPTSVSTSWHS
jgi:hypothetical protein